MNAEEAAKNIELVVLDVDGVLTDGGLYYDHEGRITKRFNVQDGLGVKLAQSAGIRFAVITGLNHKCVEQRVTELGIDIYHPGKTSKMPSLEAIAQETGIDFGHMAYVGDDWVDIRPMRKVGLPIAVANAQPEVMEFASHVTGAKGGHGAVREALMFILRCQGKLAGLLAGWSE